MEEFNNIEKQNNNENPVKQKIEKLFEMSNDWSLSEEGGMINGIRKEVPLLNIKDMQTVSKDNEDNMIQTSEESLGRHMKLLDFKEKEILEQIGYLDNAFLKGSKEGTSFVWRIYVPLKEPTKKFESLSNN